MRDKQQKLEEVSYIDDRFLQTPAVAIEQALKELYDMLILARRTLTALCFIGQRRYESKQKIAEVEDRIDLTNNYKLFH